MTKDVKTASGLHSRGRLESNAPSTAHSQDFPRTSEAAQGAAVDDLFPLDATIKFTVFDNKSGARMHRQSTTYGQFVAQVLTPAKVYPNKAATPFIKLAEFGDRVSERGSYKTGDNMGLAYGIEVDYDGGQVAPADAAARMRTAGVEGVLCTTSSHTAQAPRWRVFCPLARPCRWTEARTHIAVLNSILGGILAGESFSIAQGYHVGRVAGVQFESHHVRGIAIDEDLFHAPYYPPGKEPRPERARRDPSEPPEVLDKETIEKLKRAAQSLDPGRFGSGDGVHDRHVEVLRALKHAHWCGWAGANDVWIDLNDRHGTPRKKADAAKEWARHPVPHSVTYRSLFALAEKDNPPTVSEQTAGFEDVNDDPAAQSDVELARLAVPRLAARGIVHEHGGRGWMQYRGGVYRRCDRGEEIEAIKGLGVDILKTARGDSDDIKRTVALAHRAMSAAGIKAALLLAQSDERIAVVPGDFDADPDALNVLNGWVHLPTGELHPHDQAQFFSRQCPVIYQHGARAPTLEQFMRDISNDDTDWVDFLQRATGYSLSGNVGEEVMFFLLGIGANGKSVFCNLMRRILGDYVVSMPANLLMQSNRDGESATPAMASLPGARIALANEIEAGARLSAQTVKVLTSTDSIPARHLYGRQFNFDPSHALWVRGNHKPIITDNDHGIWRRIVLIPFDRHFGPDEKDTGLEAAIMREAPGVLAWMVQGHLAYRARGLRRARRVEAASLAYRAESDLVGQWIEERAIRAPGAAWVQGEAYASYRTWCVEQGLRPVAKKTLTLGLAERGIGTGQETTGSRLRTYRGIKSALSCIFGEGGTGDTAQDAQD